MRNRKKLGGPYRVLHNFSLDLRTRRHILMAVLRPSLEYGCEVWNTNKCQAKALESIQFRIHTVNESIQLSNNVPNNIAPKFRHPL